MGRLFANNISKRVARSSRHDVSKQQSAAYQHNGKHQLKLEQSKTTGVGDVMEKTSYVGIYRISLVAAASGGVERLVSLPADIVWFAALSQWSTFIPTDASTILAYLNVLCVISACSNYERRSADVGVCLRRDGAEDAGCVRAGRSRLCLPHAARGAAACVGDHLRRRADVMHITERRRCLRKVRAATAGDARQRHLRGAGAYLYRHLFAISPAGRAVEWVDMSPELIRIPRTYLLSRRRTRSRAEAKRCGKTDAALPRCWCEGYSPGRFSCSHR